MKKSFSKKIHDEAIKNTPKAYGFKNYINTHPYLWRFDRNTVARGVAVGLFTAVILFIPFQTLIAIFFSILFRANLPTAFLLSWLSNPLTIFPIAYLTSMVGNWILGESAAQITIQEYHWSFISFHDFVNSMTTWILHFGKGYLVGLPIVAITLGLVGYLIVYSFWDIGKLMHYSRHR